MPFHRAYRMVVILVLSWWVCGGGGSIAWASTFYVSSAGSDDLSCSEATLFDSPRGTIQAGMECLTDAGDELLVREGTYAESLVIDGDGVSLSSGLSWENPVRIAAYEAESVILRPRSGDAVVRIEQAGLHHLILDGLEIDATGVTDGVVLQGDVHHVRFQNGAVHHADRHGIVTSSDGGPGLAKTSHEFLKMEVVDNGAGNSTGHGVFFGTSGNLVQGCFIQGNGKGADGWGIKVSQGNGNMAVNNMVWQNGNGISVGDGSSIATRLYHNTVYGNAGAGIVIGAHSVDTTIHNTISAGHDVDLEFSDSPTTIASNNLAGFPLFVDAERGDFHLQTQSPAINAGLDLSDVEDRRADALVLDYEGTDRPQQGGWDIGALEYAVLESPPAASFIALPAQGSSPLTVVFSDTSIGHSTSWSWDFGDGTGSHERHPSHTYPKSGSYTVSLMVTGPGGADAATYVDSIQVSPSSPSVDFTASPVSGTTPVSVNFSDETVGDGTSWHWNFGDGHKSTEREPTYTYSTPGTFTVALTVDGPLGSDTKSKVAYVSVLPQLGNALLDETFTQYSMTDWSVVDEGLWQAPSSWLVLNGALEQLSNIWSPPADPSALAKLGTYLWYQPGLNWKDYLVRARLRSDDNDALGLMFRYQDPDNYYRFSWDQEGGYRRLVKKVDGVFTLLAEEPVPYVRGETYAVQILAYQGVLDMSINGQSVFGGSILDDSLAQGSVALYSWFNNTSVFEGIQVIAAKGDGQF